MSIIKELLTLSNSILKEGHVDINVLMSIDDVIKTGKANAYQNLLLARVILMLKNGTFQKTSNWNEVEVPASVITYVKGLSSDTLIELATAIKKILAIKNLDTLNKFYNPTLELAMWQRLILSHQE